MTREEASNILDDYDVNFYGHDAREIAEAFDVAFKALEQEPCDDAVSRQAVLDGLRGCICDEWVKTLFATMVKQLPPVQPTADLSEYSDKLWRNAYERGKTEARQTGKCKDCKYFEYDSFAKVDGIPLIVAHEICTKWGDGCKTKEDGYCFMFEEKQDMRGDTNETERFL